MINTLRGEKVNPLGHPLSPREKQICQAVYDGLKNRQIALELHLAEGTIKAYLVRVFAKAGVSNRISLSRWWESHNEPLPQINAR